MLIDFHVHCFPDKLAAGAVGSWVAAENKKEIRKMMKKAEKGAMRALDQLESMRR